MKIYLGGTVSVVHETLQLMALNGIPFTHYIHYGDLIISKGSRKVLSSWKYANDARQHLYNIVLLVRERDLDLIVLLSTAELILLFPTGVTS